MYQLVWLLQNGTVCCRRERLLHNLAMMTLQIDVYKTPKPHHFSIFFSLLHRQSGLDQFTVMRHALFYNTKNFLYDQADKHSRAIGKK